MTMSVLAPTDPEAPPMSVGCAQLNMRTKVGAKEAACVDATAAYVDVARAPSQKAAGPDEGYP